MILNRHPPNLAKPVLAIVFSTLFVAIPFSDSFGQYTFEEGKAFYEQRAANADSFLANSTNINKAIHVFEKLLDQNINPEKSATYLLKSYYFKGMFTGLSKDQQKGIYDKGRDWGEKMADKFPNSAPIKFWHGANIGQWANVHGFIKAATSGIAKKLRRISKDIIKLDSSYQGGGGYRILAQVHYYSPNIPLLMGWPSNDKALELIEKAMSIAPNHPTNRMLYAEILLEFDRDEEAKKQLEYILTMTPRSTHQVEDRYVKHRSAMLLEEHF